MDQHVPSSPPDCLSDVLHVADALRFLQFGGWVREDIDAGKPYWAGLEDLSVAQVRETHV